MRGPAFGRVSSNQSKPSGRTNADRLTSVTDATHGNESYTFDDVGNRLDSHLASSYGYQVGHFNRLTSAVTPTQTVTYSYDAVRRLLIRLLTLVGADLSALEGMTLPELVQESLRFKTR